MGHVHLLWNTLRLCRFDRGFLDGLCCRNMFGGGVGSHLNHLTLIEFLIVHHLIRNRIEGMIDALFQDKVRGISGFHQVFRYLLSGFR